MTLKVGDKVRVLNTDQYVSWLAKKLKDRVGTVTLVGPDAIGMWKGQAHVKFGQRNGRGKEFSHHFLIKELVKEPEA
ncbi:SH3 domain-containing protein [Ferribacterium limneticum]|uniref:hypothetical protein n=1 Tax=Ferribacterium limneticum TaxID=76259 RepID=UPI001CF8A2B2|nr:hypothetical protein [Ferribacterium limneticum]UCV26712.1 hypothetical protein KI617_10365 [Ferribacterium limneticum]UCV30629.1 hypothetical protein KI608_10365 [Ferribacterium limneticum]